MSEMLDAALRYCEDGLWVVRADGKAAFDKGWNKDAPPNWDKIEAMWSDGDWNVGLAIPDGCIVIDVEASGLGWWSKIAPHGVTTRTAKTGGGGLHLWFRLAEGQSADCLPGKLPENAGDIKLPMKGFVVAPPSIHPGTKARYLWIDEGDLAPLPDWLYDAIRKPRTENGTAKVHQVTDPAKYAAKAVANAVAEITAAPSGARNVTLVKAATNAVGVAKALGADLGDVEATLKGAGAEAGLTRSEVDRAVRWALENAEPASLSIADKPTVRGTYSTDYKGNIAKTSDNLRMMFLNEPGLHNILRYDAFNGREEAFVDGKWRPVTDWDWMWLQRVIKEVTGIHFKDEYVKAVVDPVCQANTVNPLTEWLSSLQWDGVPRLAGLFPNYFGTVDNEYTRRCGEIFCISAVARAYEPGCKVDTIPIISGSQGAGKSTGVKVLTGEQWFRDSPFSIDDHRRVMQQLSGVWIYEMPELSTIQRSKDVEGLKAFITSTHDSGVPPYGRRVVTRARTVVFFGTTNDNEYLRDRTGNRRFLPLTCEGGIDLAGVARDREQLWAEAAHRYYEGNGWLMPRELYAVTEAVQAEAVVTDPWEDLIAEWIMRNPHKWPRGEWISSTVLMNDVLEIKKGGATVAEAKRMAGILRSMGHRKQRRNSGSGWVRSTKED